MSQCNVQIRTSIKGWRGGRGVIPLYPSPQTICHNFPPLAHSPGLILTQGAFPYRARTSGSLPDAGEPPAGGSIPHCTNKGPKRWADPVNSSLINMNEAHCTEKKGPVRIQYKCLVPVYIFSEMKLLFPKQNYNVLSPSSCTHISVCERSIYLQDHSAYSAAGKYVDWSWEYINSS